MRKLCKVIYTVSYETYLDLEVPEDYEGVFVQNDDTFEEIFNDNSEILYDLDIPDSNFNTEYREGSTCINKFVIN